jgi:hypothetical protein
MLFATLGKGLINAVLVNVKYYLLFRFRDKSGLDQTYDLFSMNHRCAERRANRLFSGEMM